MRSQAVECSAVFSDELSDAFVSVKWNSQTEEGEEDEEIKDLFNIGKKRKRKEKSPAEIVVFVKNVMAELELHLKGI